MIETSHVARVLGHGGMDGGLGTFATLQRSWTADACIIPEPTNLDIIPANSGALTFPNTATSSSG